jgi:hypothetical protein
MTEDLEEKCTPCQECFGSGNWPCIDLTGEKEDSFRVTCEVCYGWKCFKVEIATINGIEYNVSSEFYKGEYNGHCGHFRDKESYLKSLEK